MKRFLFAVEADTSRLCGRKWRISEKMTPENIEDLKARCQEEVGEDFVILDSAKRPEFLGDKAEHAIGNKGSISEENYLHESSGSKRFRSVFLWPRAHKDATPSAAQVEKSGTEVDGN